MKVIKAFFLGVLGGLALTVLLLVGLYFSPLRETVYLRTDSKLAEVQAKVSEYREWLDQADLYIVEKGPETSDSLRTAQTLAWGEYKKWRNHLGELARAHTKPTANGFLSWTYSLRVWVVPIGTVLTLFPALWVAWRTRVRSRPGRLMKRAHGTRIKAQDEAITSLEDAVKKIARISDGEPKPPTVPKRVEGDDRDTEPISVVSGSSLAATPEPTDSDELSTEELEEDAEDEDSPGVMPPTTELEKVERRKDEVLKWARRGLTSSEISRRMRISQDQVEFIIRLRREKG